MNAKRVIAKTLQALMAVAALLLVILWMSGAFRKKIEAGEADIAKTALPEGAQVARVIKEHVPVIEEASGTVEAKRKTMVSSRIMASIREVKVRAGDEVSEGEVLVVLDDRDLAARAQQAQRAVDAAQAAFSKAGADYQRAKELLSRNVIGRSEFDTSESAYKVAEASLDSARKASEAAEVGSSFAAITAPVSGRVVERYAEPGDTATAGQPLLAVYDPESLRIAAPVRESLLSNVKVGDILNVRLGDSKETIQGKIGEIVPEAEVGSRTFLVKVDLPSGENIYTGMFARILIPSGQRERLTIDRAAIQTIGQLNFVNVVGKDGTVSRRLVTLGPAADEKAVEILSGLDEGESVVLSSV